VVVVRVVADFFKIDETITSTIPAVVVVMIARIFQDGSEGFMQRETATSVNDSL